MSSHISTSERFFIALVPPKDVKTYAREVIQELSDRYRTRTANVPPHITLQPPFLWDIQEVDRLEACLKSFASAHSSIPIQLSGFGSFAPRVIYIHVEKTGALLALQAGLAAHLETQLGVVNHEQHRRPYNPHVTVASRDMTPEIFQQAWSELASRSVTFEFSGDRLTLYHYQHKCWRLYADYALTGGLRSGMIPHA